MQIGSTRTKRAKLNIVVSLIAQAITLVCGFIVPRMFIGAFGSEAYGATASIQTFLNYIALLEGGIGGVARAALYKPLADKDTRVISAVVCEIKRFFRMIAYIFVIYVIILACTYKYISHTEIFDWASTFALVIVISISTFAQYFIGISYSVLLQAAQKTYITQTVSIVATVLNAILVVVLIKFGFNIIWVKLFSSIVFACKPIALWLIVRKQFKLIPHVKDGETHLSQKWTGLGQHIAYFLHSNTDVAVLTVFVNLSTVAIYSVYHMVVAHIQNIASSFMTGMESIFGDMIAKGERETLQKTFSVYETVISFVSIVLFSTTLVLIIPFIKVYTAKVTDVDYVAPLFAVLLISASLIYCFRSPYHSVVIAAGHFKQTRLAAYLEAIINIVSSILLVLFFGLVGVAIGTVLATAFRLIFYVVYLSKYIMQRSVFYAIKRILINALSVLCIYFAGRFVISFLPQGDLLSLALCGIVVVIIAAAVCLAVNMFFYRKDVLSYIKSKKNKKAKA